MPKGINLFRVFLLFCSIACLCSSCSSQRFIDRKYPPSVLKKDFAVFRGALEELHPSLYWFTPKDSLDREFSEAYRRLDDSLTERQFRTALLKVVTAIRCGHTSVNFSRKYSRYLDTAQLSLFPLAFKVMPDTLVVTGNLNRSDTLLTRGTVVTAINNRSAGFLIDTILHYITGDGYAEAGRYQSLSSFGTFGVMYKNLFGLTGSFHIRYLNKEGMADSVTIPVFTPAREEEKADSLKSEKYTARERRNLFAYSARSLQVDTLLHSGYMIMNTFAPGHHIRPFIRRSFKNLERLGIRYLVIDVRSNGGGDAGTSTLLTQYIADHSFVLADSLYALRRSTRYRDYIPMQPVYWLMATTVTRKRRDGRFHFGYFEHHRFEPRKKHHFNGNVYLLTGGNSFSATTLFVQQLKGQKNVQIIGEETGGGAYGNTAWIIPELTLPHTGLRISIPRFRFVMRKDLLKDGRGVIPDIQVSPTSSDIRNGIDVKVEAVRQLIMQANGY